MAHGGSAASHTPESYILEAAQPIIITTQLHAQSTRRKKLNQYLRCERIGKGRHGEVYLCRDTHMTQRNVAIKAVKRSNRHDKIKLLRKTYQQQDGEAHTRSPKLSSTENSIRKEIAVMKRCRHPNLATLFEVIDDPQEDKIYLVMEYLSGGPVEWATPEEKPLLTLSQTRRIMRDVILGLEFMHAMNILHRDIKPANIVYTEDRRSVKLIDFGVSHITYPHSDRKRKSEDTDPDADLFPRSDLLKRIGTPSFLAPEVVWFSDTVDYSSSGSHSTIPASFHNPSDTIVGSSIPMPKVRPPITKAVDIWALGVTFYCLLFGHTPFNGSTSDNGSVHHHEFMLYHQICTQDWLIDNVMGAERIPTEGRQPENTQTDGYLVVQLLEEMMQKNPLDRASLSEIKRHPFILRDVLAAKEWLRATSQLDSLESGSWIKAAARKFVGLLSKHKS